MGLRRIADADVLSWRFGGIDDARVSPLGRRGKCGLAAGPLPFWPYIARQAPRWTSHPFTEQHQQAPRPSIPNHVHSRTRLDRLSSPPHENRPLSSTSDTVQSRLDFVETAAAPHRLYRVAQDIHHSNVTMTRTSSSPPQADIPLLYRLVFLYIEPISTLLGAFYAQYRQSLYLQLTHAASAPPLLPTGTSVVLTQLANLYFLLCINEALVLRSTTDLKVWKTFLFGLLVADFGHLFSVRLVGSWVYWQFWEWNSMDLGNVPFVYFLAVVRIFFLAGVGIGSVEAGRTKTLKST
jgi:hypothetical protein